jgi:hypothetical protein
LFLELKKKPGTLGESLPTKLALWRKGRLFVRLEPAWKITRWQRNPQWRGQALVAIVVLAVGYVCDLNLRTRKAAFGRDPARFDGAPQIKEHGIDLQARRKPFDDVCLSGLRTQHCGDLAELSPKALTYKPVCVRSFVCEAGRIFLRRAPVL